MKQTLRTRRLVEASLLVALATVLSILKIAELPYGGSITLASMFPILLLSYRHGMRWGLGGGLVYGVLQQLLGLNNLSYFTTWQSILAIIFLDYIIAFAVVGLGGIFRRVVEHQAISLGTGALFVCVLRYLCHVVSGATVWAGLSIPDGAALAYSFIYNATYMIPEAIILLVIAAYIGSNVNFQSKLPTRMKRADLPQNLGWLAPVAGLIAVIATIADTLMIFPKLQNADSGEFDITGLASVNWTLVVAITAVAILITASLLAIRSVLATKSKA
jgi:thiamine transporter